ncbi:hypothetical protein ACPIXP_002493 [Citrobacter freundii]|nr:hypothetical protein [Citrobacter freundii]
MTNVSAVEKMAELMQQMEENSPRVTALQYCLKLVGNKLEEVEKRISELEAKCAALAAENAGLKSEVPLGAIENGRTFAERLEAYPFECQGGNLNMCSDWQELRRCFEHLSEWAMHGQKETPATDSFLAEVRAQGVDAAIEHLNKKFAGTGHIGVPVMALEWLAQELRKGAKS